MCAGLIRHGSRSFHAAGRLLPGDVRAAAFAVYGFCRLSDDAVDVDGGDVRAVARLRGRLDAIYRGAPQDHPVDRALADVVVARKLPKALLEALLEGLAWDAEGRTFARETDLMAYAARVAGAVGAVMAVLMGVRDRERLARACDLGAAMQLTNIARDIGEDARAGRIYVPQEWLDEVGLDRGAFLARPVFDARVAALTSRLLARAEALYRRAEPGVAALPLRVRPAIFAARLIYAEIGSEIAAAGFDSVSRRAVVPSARKRVLMMHAVRAAVASGLGPVLRRGGLIAPVLPECAFLVDAAAAPVVPPPPTGLDADIAWVMDLFADLHRRQMSPRGAQRIGGEP